MKRVVILLQAVVFILVIHSCSTNSEKETSGNNNQNSDTKELVVYKATQSDGGITGRELYRLNCSGCHGIDLKGNPPTYPSLQNIQKRFTKAEIRNIIGEGKGNMPPLAHLEHENIDAILNYLFGEEKDTESQETVKLNPAQKGKMLFQSNCLGCHRAKPSDPEPQNAGKKMCNMMIPATLGGIDQRYALSGFSNILDKGPCYMPSFSFLEEEDRMALYTYLKSLDVEWQGRREHPKGGEHPMNREHPKNNDHPRN